MAVRTFAQLLDRYKHGERNFAESELDEDPQNDCTGVCLDGADLSRSCIVATFRDASLRGAKFVEANVKTCDFRGADLRDADFSGAALCATQFSGAKLEGARFGGATAHSYVFGNHEQPTW